MRQIHNAPRRMTSMSLLYICHPLSNSFYPVKFFITMRDLTKGASDKEQWLMATEDDSLKPDIRIGHPASAFERERGTTSVVLTAFSASLGLRASHV